MLHSHLENESGARTHTHTVDTFAKWLIFAEVTAQTRGQIYI